MYRLSRTSLVIQGDSGYPEFYLYQPPAKLRKNITSEYDYETTPTHIIIKMNATRELYRMIGDYTRPHLLWLSINAILRVRELEAEIFNVRREAFEVEEEYERIDAHNDVVLAANERLADERDEALERLRANEQRLMACEQRLRAYEQFYVSNSTFPPAQPRNSQNSFLLGKPTQPTKQHRNSSSIIPLISSRCLTNPSGTLVLAHMAKVLAPGTFPLNCDRKTLSERSNPSEEAQN